MSTKKQYMLKVFILLLPIYSISCLANESAAYDDAQAIGACAGMLEFTSQILAAQGKPASAENFHQKANGWRIATMGALSEANWKPENINSTADSIYNSALTNWQSNLERGDPNIISDLELSTSKCKEINEKQESYRKAIKQKSLTN